jgi:hypothetical protein
MVSAISTAAVALSLSVAASAGVGMNAKTAEQLRDQQQQQQQAPAPQQQQAPRQEQSRAQMAPRQQAQNARQPNGGRNMQTQPGQPQVGGRIGPAPYGNSSRGNPRGDDRNVGRGWNPGDNRNNGNWNNRPPRVVNSLPRGYRDYNYNGNRYYYSGGSWYRPWGSSYLSIGVPYGLFVTTLPGAYSSFWYGGSRYFYADDTYYTYEPVRRGYVVSRSPYGGDEEESSDTNYGDELFIYPAKGQTEQQQADDRYECHSWAVGETHYDPIDDDYDAKEREGYQRAVTACLTGRGYTVK